MVTEADSRIVVVGASGNVGTSVLDALEADDSVTSVRALARRLPEPPPPHTKVCWEAADTARDDLTPHLRGAAAVIHLAWLFQPTRDPVTTWRTNILGSIHVFEAAAEAEVPALVYGSSVGAYSPGPKDRGVDERWETHGWPDAAYTREKAYLERYLDTFESDHPSMRVVRLRPAFSFKRESASEQRRLFLGPFLPNTLARPELLPIVPDLPGLRFQALHTRDAADAYRLAATRPVRGAFNLAADPVVDATMLADLFNARVATIPRWVARTGVSGAWRLHLIPASPGLFDAMLHMPIMDTTKARTELGWSPQLSAQDALQEFVRGLRERAGAATPPLAPELPGGRTQEVRTGIGSRP